jgi:type III pantothenate kinase
MLLVLDVGNSHTVAGLYDGDVLRGHWRIATSNHRTSDELRLLFMLLLQEQSVTVSDVRGCAISSVVPQMDRDLMLACTEMFGQVPLMVTPDISTGLTLLCDNPQEVGADRLVNAVAAVEEYGDRNLVVVDFGTATTFDVITANKEYLGGIIAPGIQLCAEALFERCAKLPKVDIVQPKSVIGRNTLTNIRSGLTYGYADMVDGLLTRIANELGTEPMVVATGGLAQVIKDIARRIHLVDPWLTLKGLRMLYDKQTPSVSHFMESDT